MPRRASNARHSRVYSSSRLSHFKLRPSLVRSNIKSHVHTSSFPREGRVEQDEATHRKIGPADRVRLAPSASRKTAMVCALFLFVAVGFPRVEQLDGSLVAARRSAGSNCGTKGVVVSVRVTMAVVGTLLLWNSPPPG